MKSKFEDELKEIQIDFQENFNKEIISLKVNDCLIVENEKILSNSTTGFSGTRIILRNPDVLIVKKQERKVECNFNLDSVININVVVDNKSNSFIIDIKKGKFIGITNKNNSLKIIQSKLPFEYD